MAGGGWPIEIAQQNLGHALLTTENVYLDVYPFPTGNGFASGRGRLLLAPIEQVSSPTFAPRVVVP